MSQTKPISLILAALITAAGVSSLGRAATDQTIKERELYGKAIRTRMPPQLIIDSLQKQFNLMGPKWKTSWRTFVVEDDPIKNEFVIVARTAERPWSFGLTKPDCPKPEDYEKLRSEAAGNGTNERLDVLIGVKKERSWFRYVVNVYKPMYAYWKNPCYQWSLPSGGLTKDSFYSENYTLKAYAENMSQKVYDEVKILADWKPPKNVKKIPSIKGPGQEFIGGEAEELTDDERALPLIEQQKIIEQKRKEKKKKKD